MKSTLNVKNCSWDQFASLPTAQKIEFFKKDGRLYDVLISQQFNRELLEELINIANATRRIAKTKEGMIWLKNLLPHKRAMLYFIQPSTRTFLSFLNACHILGISISEVRDPSTSSEVKGETYEDTIRTFSSYVDVIIMRHPQEGYSEKATWVLNNSDRPVPIFNAGSGRDQHPTQALLDIYTLHRNFAKRGGIDGKTIAMVGDLQRGRTVRSLSYLLSNYEDVTLYFVAPERFQMKEDIKSFLEKKDISYHEVDNIDKILGKADAVYMTRIQDEHDVSGESKNYDYSNYRIGPENLSALKEDAIIMHPLPRRNEIDPIVDNDPRAKYWRQERNGMWIRAALLIKVFNVEESVIEYYDSTAI